MKIRLNKYVFVNVQLEIKRFEMLANIMVMVLETRVSGLGFQTFKVSFSVLRHPSLGLELQSFVLGLDQLSLAYISIS